MFIGDDHEDNKHDYDDRGHNDSRSNLNSHQIPPRVFKLNIQSVFNLVSNVEYDGSDNEISSFLLQAVPVEPNEKNFRHEPMGAQFKVC